MTSELSLRRVPDLVGQSLLAIGRRSADTGVVVGLWVILVMPIYMAALAFHPQGIGKDVTKGVLLLTSYIAVLVAQIIVSARRMNCSWAFVFERLSERLPALRSEVLSLMGVVIPFGVMALVISSQVVPEGTNQSIDWYAFAGPMVVLLGTLSGVFNGPLLHFVAGDDSDLEHLIDGTEADPSYAIVAMGGVAVFQVVGAAFQWQPLMALLWLANFWFLQIVFERQWRALSYTMA